MAILSYFRHLLLSYRVKISINLSKYGDGFILLILKDIRYTIKLYYFHNRRFR